MNRTTVFANTEVIEARCDMGQEITGLCTSSRTAGEGMLFFGLPGVADGARHGRDFALSAAAAGALPVLDALPDPAPEAYILVRDVRKALAECAAEYYGHPEREMKIVGVTGTKGKTTVTHLLKHVLEDCLGAKVGLIGTNHILIGDRELPSANTTPEAHELSRYLREMADAGCGYAVMEVSSHSLALSRVKELHFAAAAFLNLTLDHLDYHKTMENYAAAKALIFGMSDTAVISADADFSEMMISAAKDIPTTLFSTRRNDVGLVAKDIRLQQSGCVFEAVAPGELHRVRLPIPGMFSVYNALAVLGLARALGISLSAAAESLAGAGNVRGRCEAVETGSDFGVIIDYAHTPDSLSNILRTVRGFTAGRVIAVFGCGGDRDRTKRPIMGAIAAELSDVYYVTSDNPRTEVPEAIIEEILAGVKGKRQPRAAEPDRRSAIRAAIAEAKAGDTVVIAGKGHEDYQEIMGVKHHFEDREEVLAALELFRKGE